MDKSTIRKDIDLSVREIHNAVEELKKGPGCHSEDDGDGHGGQIPCNAEDFWRWLWE